MPQLLNFVYRLMWNYPCFLSTLGVLSLIFYSAILSDDVDTRAITRRLRQDGSLIGVLSTERSKTDDELLEMSRSWDIVGMK